MRRFFVNLAAITSSALLLYTGIELSGGGHGWAAGTFACLLLTPVSFLSVSNALQKFPSRKKAIRLLVIGVTICFYTILNSYFSSYEYSSFFKVIRQLQSDSTILLTFVAICFNWLFACLYVACKYRVH